MLISKITEKWRTDITDENESLEKAGMWIGRLERFLILTLVLLKQYEAIGLLVAAKSIFRFSASRSVGEYVLIGTLLSFTIAIIVGLVASLFFKLCNSAARYLAVDYKPESMCFYKKLGSKVVGIFGSVLE